MIQGRSDAASLDAENRIERANTHCCDNQHHNANRSSTVLEESTIKERQATGKGKIQQHKSQNGAQSPVESSNICGHGEFLQNQI